VGSLRSNADIWDYAKQAGFRTVFIDAQAPVNKTASQLQNFMTVQEAAKIDRFVTFDEVATPQLDRELIKVVEEELNGSQPVFIYANKNGAHFPYSYGYPEDQAPFGRSGAEGDDVTSSSSLITSYLNNVRWNVDELLSDFIENADLTNTLVLYTSDHGQVLEPGGITHCSVETPDPREALVPMLAMTSRPDLVHRLNAAALQWRGKAGHFLMMPTVLQLMGYGSDVTGKRLGPSLFDNPGTASVGFTSGDIFGLFRNEVRWHDLDLAQSYLEHDAIMLRHTAQPTAKLVEE
jgi:lipid A ethanolaminephosphotransferase